MKDEPQGAAMAEEQATDEALKAVAEPRRRAILRLVAEDELPAGEIAAAFDVSRTAVSQHLTVLKNAGLLTERRDGTRRLYRARPEGLAGLPPQNLLLRRFMQSDEGIAGLRIGVARSFDRVVDCPEFRSGQTVKRMLRGLS